MGESFDHRPAGWDQTKPQMLYPIYPQPYGSGLSVGVKYEFCDPLSAGLHQQTGDGVLHLYRLLDHQVVNDILRSPILGGIVN